MSEPPSAPSASSAAPSGAPPAKPPQPTEFPPAVKATIAWLQGEFGKWYAANPPPSVDRFTRREFGFILFPDKPGTPPFLRHRGYADVPTFQRELKRGPHSVYYSTAYYRRPWEMKMADKQWMGAELIFDLDADHLAEAEKAKAEGHEMPLSEQLKIVKTQFKRLLDEFLFGDFGLSEKDVWITFSGGRGYHAHVVHDGFMQLGNRERREIVDYVTGKFPVEKGKETPALEHLFDDSEAVQAKAFGKHVKVDRKVRFPTPDDPGWGGRLARDVVALVKTNVLEVEPEQAKAWLLGKNADGSKRFDGIGETKADAFLKFMTAEKLDRYAYGYLASDGSRRGKGELTGTSGAGNVAMQIFAQAATKYSLPMAKGETDEPVTADTKRLIRLPGSLHGKSGLKVVTLTRSLLDGFEPLRDAVAFPSTPTAILPRKDQEITLGGERIAVKAGERTEIPMPHAVFFLSRQGGTIAPS